MACLHWSPHEAEIGDPAGCLPVVGSTAPCNDRIHGARLGSVAVAPRNFLALAFAVLSGVSGASPASARSARLRSRPTARRTSGAERVPHVLRLTTPSA